MLVIPLVSGLTSLTLAGLIESNLLTSSRLLALIALVKSEPPFCRLFNFDSYLNNLFWNDII